MLEAVGSKVSKLVRTAIGPVRIDELPIGKWRALMADEIAALGGRAIVDSYREWPAGNGPIGNTSESRRKPRPGYLSNKNPGRSKF
jgi:hypothetical protein